MLRNALCTIKPNHFNERIDKSADRQFECVHIFLRKWRLALFFQSDWNVSHVRNVNVCWTRAKKCRNRIKVWLQIKRKKKCVIENLTLAQHSAAHQTQIEWPSSRANVHCHWIEWIFRSRTHLNRLTIELQMFHLSLVLICARHVYCLSYLLLAEACRTIAC